MSDRKQKGRIFSYEMLNHEYLNWALKYGEERNKDDLRFGQYLDSRYEIQHDWIDDVYYSEDYEIVYRELLNKLHEATEK